MKDNRYQKEVEEDWEMIRRERNSKDVREDQRRDMIASVLSARETYDVTVPQSFRACTVMPFLCVVGEGTT